MNTAVQHGQLTLEVPGDWADTSTVVYLAPLREGLSAALSGRAAPTYRSNVTVSIEGRPKELATPEDFLASLGVALRFAGIDAKDLGTGPFELAGLEGAIAVRSVHLDGQRVRQWTAVAFAGDNVIVATASTAESEATRDEAMLRRVLSSVRHAGASGAPSKAGAHAPRSPHTRG